MMGVKKFYVIFTAVNVFCIIKQKPNGASVLNHLEL